MPLSEARKNANERWNNKHKDKKRVYSYRSNARKFIREMATPEDIAELRELLGKREQELKEN